MNVSKTGILSLILGLVLLVGTYFLLFQESGAVAMLASAASGLLVIAGLFLLVLGVIMLVL